jgi:thioredoxin-related protein
MKALLAALLLLCAAYAPCSAQKQDSFKIYNPKADAQAEINKAVARAAKEHKHVFLQIGGNWCKWCKYFNTLVTTNDTLNQLLKNNYIVLHVNYSPENRNEKVLAKLGYPQRFGFPVFVILDAKGNRLHTQNSAYLEEGQGHDPQKVAEFLQQWSPSALDPARYIDGKR